MQNHVQSLLLGGLVIVMPSWHHGGDRLGSVAAACLWQVM